jgi:hypothetical protein
MKAVELKKKDYTIQIGYSEKAIKDKMVKFITPSGDSFEISSEELISTLMNQVNMDTLSPTFVETDKINVVEVGRQLECVLDEDMKKGQKIRLNYSHPYPVEFALLEEAYKIAKINMDTPRYTITKEYLDKVQAQLKPGMSEYINKFYKTFKNVKI